MLMGHASAYNVEIVPIVIMCINQSDVLLWHRVFARLPERKVFDGIQICWSTLGTKSVLCDETKFFEFFTLESMLDPKFLLAARRKYHGMI